MDKHHQHPPYKLYVSYVDKELVLFKEFKKHLSLLQENDLIKIWSKEDIKLGKTEKTERRRNAKEADIMLFLVSIELLIDPSVKNIEIKIALKRKKAGEDLTIIPVLVRRCHWTISALAKLKPFTVLPKNQIPINLWSDRDNALSEVVESIHEVILTKEH